MLSDDSSSDSETGRFKHQSKPKEEKSSKKEDSFRSTGRSRHSDNDRFRRDQDRKQDSFRSRDRPRYSRHSSASRRRHSGDRSHKRSPDRHRRRDSRDKSKPRDHRRNDSRERSKLRDHRPNDSRERSKPRDHRRNDSRERSKPRDHRRNDSRERSKPRDHRRNDSRERSKPRDHRRSSSRSKKDRSRSKSHKEPEIKSRSHRSPESSKSHKSPERKRTIESKDEIKKTVEPKISHSKQLSDRRSRDKSESPELNKKHSEVHKAPPAKRRASSPIVLEHSDKCEEVQPGSYYNMIPAIVKEKSDESSEIDSSDDERLRAKLLNLEKELQKTKKKKHKKRHKKKSSKTNKEKDETNASVEVTSTTDIQDVIDVTGNQDDAVPEVSSTQKNVPKESSEEGEISSDDDTQESQEIEEDYDPSDLRHKLRSKSKSTSKADICGPALPPHLEKRYRRSSSVEIEGPVLPPHLQPTKHIGPSIASDLRKVLAEREYKVVEDKSSDEDPGIGPLPAGAESKWSSAHQRLEERALDIKIKKIDGQSLDSQKVKSREQWMLELPEGKAKYLGLEARSFRAKEGPDMSDRSSWTDTPEEKARKAAGLAKEEDADEAMRRDARARQIANRDEEQESAVKKHKKKHKRDESLLEMHQKKLKKKKKKDEKEDGGKTERRPFSRDVDLQVNRFDEAQKKSIIKKAQGLNSRFSQGEAKYL